MSVSPSRRPRVKSPRSYWYAKAGEEPNVLRSRNKTTIKASRVGNLWDLDRLIRIRLTDSCRPGTKHSVDCPLASKRAEQQGGTMDFYVRARCREGQWVVCTCLAAIIHCVIDVPKRQLVQPLFRGQ
jgi:hypothetical protein